MKISYGQFLGIKLTFVAGGLILGNFIYQWLCGANNWNLAIDRSFFQLWAVWTVWLVSFENEFDSFKKYLE